MATIIAPGVEYIANYISRKQEQDIINTFPKDRFNKVMFRGMNMLRTKTWQSDQVEGRRPVYIFPGYEQMPPQDDWDECIVDIRDEIHNDFGQLCTQAIMTLYNDGNAAIGCHKDKHDDDFYIISVGATRDLCFSEINSQKLSTIAFKVPLENRSILHVTKQANRDYYHFLRKESQVTESRISIVYRPIPIE